MRRSIVTALVACLLVGLMLGPVEAKKKKKGKKKPPITFTADGSLILGNPGDLNDAGLTRNEFLTNCAIPASQGVDGYVIEVSEEIGAVTSDIYVSGSDATGTLDLDMYLYSADCAQMGAFSTAESNEVGFMAPGTKYVVVTAFLGAEATFTFEATQTAGV